MNTAVRTELDKKATCAEWVINVMKAYRVLKASASVLKVSLDVPVMTNEDVLFQPHVA
jgi:hypothetical protein